MKRLICAISHKIYVNSRANPIRATPKLQTSTRTAPKGHTIVYLLIAIIIIVASAYTAYSLLYNPDTPSSPFPSPMSPIPSSPTATVTPPTVATSSSSKPTPSSTNAPTPTPEPTSITVIDGIGRSVTIKQPINRIVSINYGLTEIVCAIGCQNLIVGRDELSITPPSVTSIPIVASSSNDPNMELLLESKPDLILADSMIRTKTQVLDLIEDAGIPLYIESTGSFSRILECIRYMGRILNKEQTATELHDFLTRYQTLAADRIANVPPNQQPRVYVEWTTPWYTATHTSIVGLMTAAGGINVAEGGLSTTMGDISPEYVAEANPDIILKVVSGTSYGTAPLKAQRDDVLGRSLLSETNAVKNQRVYTYYNIITQGIRYPIGLLYCEKWLYPDLLSDIDPTAVQAELYQKFFGITLEGVFTYP